MKPLAPATKILSFMRTVKLLDALHSGNPILPFTTGWAHPRTAPERGSVTRSNAGSFRCAAIKPEGILRGAAAAGHRPALRRGRRQDAPGGLTAGSTRPP